MREKRSMCSRAASRLARSAPSSGSADDADPRSRATMTARWRELLTQGFFVASALVLLWDIALAGQIAQVRRAPRSFRALTALAGLLIAPATIIAVTSASILEGRA